MIHFEYGKMWRHYIDRVGQPTDDIYVRVYSTDYVTMKYDKNNEKKPFKHAGMHAWKINKNDLIYKHKMFEHGAYVLGDKIENRKKNLFVVAPEKIKDFYVANHFSFLLNRGSAMPLHFHMTNYIPYPGHLAGTQGIVVRFSNHLPNNFSLPLTVHEFMSSDLLLEGLYGFASPIHDILSRPWVHPTESRSQRQEGAPAEAKNLLQVGNGRRRRFRRYKFTTMDFHNMFRILPIHKIFVFAMKRYDDTFDVTIIIRDRLHHVPNHGDFAFVLKMTRYDLYDDDTLEMEIARCMHNKSWQDFVDIPDP